MTRLSSLLLALVAAGPVAAADTTIHTIPTAQLGWETTPEGVAFAALEGDRFVEPYMAMVRLPAGLISPAHTKSADMYGVMISGTMTHVPLGADPADGAALPPGSYYRVPAGVPHVSSCISDTDCVTFLYQDGKFDFLPVSQ